MCSSDMDFLSFDERSVSGVLSPLKGKLAYGTSITSLHIVSNEIFGRLRGDDNKGVAPRTPSLYPVYTSSGPSIPESSTIACVLVDAVLGHDRRINLCL